MDKKVSKAVYENGFNSIQLPMCKELYCLCKSNDYFVSKTLLKYIILVRFDIHRYNSHGLLGAQILMQKLSCSIRSSNSFLEITFLMKVQLIFLRYKGIKPKINHSCVLSSICKILTNEYMYAYIE